MIKCRASIDFSLPDGQTMMSMAIKNNDGDLIRVLVNSKNDFIESELGRISEYTGRSLMNEALIQENLVTIKVFALNESSPLNHFAQHGLREAALKLISTEKEKLGIKILNYLFGPDAMLREKAKNLNIDVDLSKYFN